MANRTSRQNRSGSSGQKRRPSKAGVSAARTGSRGGNQRRGTGAGTQPPGGTRPRADNNRGGSRRQQAPRTGQEASAQRRVRGSEQPDQGRLPKAERRRRAMTTAGEREHKRRGSRARAGGPTLKRKTSRRTRGGRAQ